MAQAGAWDVDGTGMQAIDDQTVAAKLRNKVNDFNVQTILVSLAITAVYAVLPFIWQQ